MTELDAPPSQSAATRSRPARRLIWLAAGTAVVLAVVAAGWFYFGSAKVVWPGDGEFGVSLPAPDASERFAVGSMLVCLQGVDSAVVDDVTSDSGGLLISDFAVRPSPEPPDMVLGSQAGPLASSGFGAGRTLTGRCADGGRSEIGVEIGKRTPQTARTDSLLVHWSAGIRSGTVRIPAHLVLCGSADTDGAECTPIP